MAAGTVRFDGSAQALMKMNNHSNLTQAFLHLTRKEEGQS